MIDNNMKYKVIYILADMQTCADSGSSDIRNPVFWVILGIDYTVRYDQLNICP